MKKITGPKQNEERIVGQQKLGSSIEEGEESNRDEINDDPLGIGILLRVACGSHGHEIVGEAATHRVSPCVLLRAIFFMYKSPLFRPAASAQ